MDWVWTWSGKSFGYIDNNCLWTHDGRHVGKVVGDEIYGKKGKYLGEIKSDNRLITSKSKRSKHSNSFVPYGKRGAYTKYADYAGFVMYAGYDDFPEL